MKIIRVAAERSPSTISRFGFIFLSTLGAWSGGCTTTTHDVQNEPDASLAKGNAPSDAGAPLDGVSDAMARTPYDGETASTSSPEGGSAKGDLPQIGQPTTAGWNRVCLAQVVGGPCDFAAVRQDTSMPAAAGATFELDPPGGNGVGWSGVISASPVSGHFEVDLRLAEAAGGPSATTVGSGALLVVRAGPDGKPDLDAFSGVAFQRDVLGRPSFRVIDRQPGVVASSGCAPLLDDTGLRLLVDNVLDNTCVVDPSTMDVRYTNVLSGRFTNQNDYRVPFTESNGRMRLFVDAVAGVYRFYYGVADDVLNSGKVTEGWGELAPSPVPLNAFGKAPSQHYIAVVTSGSSAPMHMNGVQTTVLPTTDVAAANGASGGTFSIASRDLTWSGFTAPAVVVNFDSALSQAPGRQLAFWNLTNNIPVWVMNDQLLVSFEFIEAWATDRNAFPGCLEPISDRFLWQNTVQVVEDTAARKVLQWSYRPATPAYRTPSNAIATSPSVIETWTIYPDGTSYRAHRYTPDSVATSVLDDTFEYSEIQLLAGSKSWPSDHAVDGNSLSLYDLNGNSLSARPAPPGFAWGTNPADGWEETIAMVGLRNSANSLEVGPSPFAVYGQLGPKIPREVTGASPSIFDMSWHGYEYMFSHWPVSRQPYQYHDKSFPTFEAEPKHSSLISVQTRGGRDPAPKEVVYLLGLASPGDVAGVKGIAASWLTPGAISQTQGCAFDSFDFRQGGAVLISGGNNPCGFSWDPPAQGLLVNPIVRIQNWTGATSPLVDLNGSTLPSGSYRTSTTANGDLLLWIEGRFTQMARVLIH